MSALARPALAYVELGRPQFILFVLPSLYLEFFLITGRAASVVAIFVPVLAFFLIYVLALRART